MAHRAVETLVCSPASKYRKSAVAQSIPPTFCRQLWAQSSSSTQPLYDTISKSPVQPDAEQSRGTANLPLVRCGCILPLLSSPACLIVLFDRIREQSHVR